MENFALAFEDINKSLKEKLLPFGSYKNRKLFLKVCFAKFLSILTQENKRSNQNWVMYTITTNFGPEIRNLLIWMF